MKADGSSSNIGSGFSLAISGDGSHVAFNSDSTDLSPQDTTIDRDLYVRDMAANSVALASIGTNGQPGDGQFATPVMDETGRFLFFTTTSRLASSDTDNDPDIYLRDTTASTTSLIGTSPPPDPFGFPPGGFPGGPPGSNPPPVRVAEVLATTGDADEILYTTDDPALSAGSGSLNGLFVRDLDANSTPRRVLTGQSHIGADMSPNGRYVAASTYATDVVPGDTEMCANNISCADIVLVDRDPDGDGDYSGTWTKKFVNVTEDGSAATGEHSYFPAVSDRGDVVFQTRATNLTCGTPEASGYSAVLRTASGHTICVGAAVLSQPDISANGRYVAAAVQNPTNSHYSYIELYDVVTDERELVSPRGDVIDNNPIVLSRPRVSSDGRYVAFAGSQTRYTPSSNPNVFNVFLRDRGVAPPTTNAAPVAPNISRTVPADKSTTVSLSGSDPDGDALTYEVTTDPLHGSLAGTAPALTYTPDAGYVGPDSFTYTVRDESGDGDSAKVSLTVSSSEGEAISQHAEAGQTVETGMSPTTDQPSQVSVTTPNAGIITITRDDSESDPPGYSLIGAQYVIEAPPASVDQPLQLNFRMAQSELPNGMTPANVQIFRNGVAIPACADNSGHADPDPCVNHRSDSDPFAIGVLSSHASSWALGVARAATLTSIEVTPASPSIAVGETQQFSATGTYSDESTADLTTSANWTSSQADVATINSGGLATAVSTGNTSITARVDTVSGAAQLTVDSAPAESPSRTIQATCAEVPATHAGTKGPDTITGTRGNDVIKGFAGDDVIYGLGGRDIICGGTGNDILNGGTGNDRLFGRAGLDNISGGPGMDICHGGPDRDTATSCERETGIRTLRR